MIRLYGQAFEFEKREEIKNNRISDEAIELEQIKEDFNLCMNNWFSKSKKLEPVIDLYLTINYHRTSLERHFLNLVQALEAYHRLTKINHVLPKKEHTARIQSIVSSLPEEHQKWVKDSLAFSNEPRLHDRMEELLTPAVKTKSPDFEAKYYHLFRLPNKEKIDIIRDIKNTRNYNTHFDEKLLRKSLKGEELFQLVLLLKAMIEFYLLTELEIDEEIVLNSTWDKVNRIDTRNSIIEATRSSNVSMW
ncbi:hypothetical protein ACA29_13705 [Lederbergia galactosidilytica]|uniref:Apea-like HEPN domain-containing protein n=1 Tax=Lederbergia galactosidilytica TaxID=217031 RepID=A0A0Q9XU19_9BACI|nr:hypothetical protein ACA29_13705 [Lederbergia galactosidilytica]